MCKGGTIVMQTPMEQGGGASKNKGARLVRFKAADMEILRPIGEMGFATVTDVRLAPAEPLDFCVGPFPCLLEILFSNSLVLPPSVGVLWRGSTKPSRPKHADKDGGDGGGNHPPF
jgi:hypothetical protein